MIHESIKKIRAILECVTPGPWAIGSGYEQSVPGNYVYSVKTREIVCAEQDDTDCVLKQMDALFIAECRNIIGDLIGEIEMPSRPRYKPRPVVSAEDVARKFHQVYEALAPQYNYKTRGDTALPWEQLPENSRRLMVDTSLHILRWMGLDECDVGLSDMSE